METKKRKLEFYGGEWMSFLPFAIFIVLIVLTTFIWGSTSAGALWIPPFLAICITFFVAKEKRYFAESVINGIASKEALIPVVCWLFAGVFSRILRESGLADALTGISAGAGVGTTTFVVIAFLASALFATAAGTGFGTIAASMGVMFPAGLALGCHPALLTGAIVGAAAFGDNLAPVSDTTIASATSQGVDVPGVVRSRLKYSLVATVITLIVTIIVGSFLHRGVSAVTSHEYNALAFFMLVAVVVTIVVAFKTGDIIVATIVGSVAGGIIGVSCGLFDFIQIENGVTTASALIKVSGTGTDRVVEGIIYNGLNSMLSVCIMALLLFGCVSIMREGGGDIKMLNALGKVAKTAAGTETMISSMIIALCMIMGLNAPAILAIGAPFVKPLAARAGIGPYRAANLLDSQSCVVTYSAPWGPTLIYAISFTIGTSGAITALQALPYIFYCWALFIVMSGSIVFGIGRKDGFELFESKEMESSSISG